MSRRTAVLAGILAAAVAVTLPAAGARRGAARDTAYTTYQQDGLASDAGEPSLGVDRRTGAVFLQAGLQTDKVVFGADGRATWSDSSSITTSLVSLDPIAYSDDTTGRLFVSQLTGASSAMAYTDDDGATWTTSQGSGLPAGADHQTVGGGPYPPEGSARPLTTYPHAVYYCSQDIVTAFCARSDTGGLTFGGGVPIYTLADCAGLHGHVKVAPDGTVYVPNADCNGHPAVAVSTDAGTTWVLHAVPGSSNGLGDPSIGIGRDGTLYLSYLDQVGAVQVSVSRDRGVTWSAPRGLAPGVVNAAFPAAVAGDGDRAAVAFLGTGTGGDGQGPDFGKDTSKTRYDGAEYHLYVATTYDRGASWSTQDLTPHDPVQRGRVCQLGNGCDNLPDRNLLDFMDAQVDRQGRVLVAWADGCTDKCVGSTAVADNGFTSRGRITRQSGGTLLYRTPPSLAG